jgi:hypothetical protein
MHAYTQTYAYTHVYMSPPTQTYIYSSIANIHACTQTHMYRSIAWRHIEIHIQTYIHTHIWLFTRNWAYIIGMDFSGHKTVGTYMEARIACVQEGWLFSSSMDAPLNTCLIILQLALSGQLGMSLHIEYRNPSSYYVSGISLYASQLVMSLLARAYRGLHVPLCFAGQAANGTCFPIVSAMFECPDARSHLSQLAPSDFHRFVNHGSFSSSIS